MTSLRISVRNTSAEGGTALTPFFAGFHDNSFDLYNLGEAASAGLEALAEDGNNSVVAGELVAADADAQSTNVVGDRGPIAAGERASAILDVNGASNGYLSLASMILPSNDAFVGTADALRLFDSNGRFFGAQTVVFTGESVRDAGTEYNTERDAAFINQTAPNTGLTEGGVVRVHEGFNGSLGNPDGILGNPNGVPGEQIILGGTNAFGETVDPTAADFTIPGSQIAEIHINTVVERDGTGGRDIIFGGSDDDIVNAGAGNDSIITRSGWDVIDAGSGDDRIYSGIGDDEITAGGGNDRIFAGAGNDEISGDAGRDLISAGSGDDQISGGRGRDWISAGSGDDQVSGDSGNDRIFGGSGEDQISGGSGHDWISGGSGNDVISGDAGRDALSGGSGHDQISGGNGDDWISGGSGNDVLGGDRGRDYLSGGSGADTFVFGEGDGIDIIRDFDQRGNDAIALDIDGVDSFDDVLAVATEYRFGVGLNFGSGDSIFLARNDLDDLSADDFIFA